MCPDCNCCSDPGTATAHTWCNAPAPDGSAAAFRSSPVASTSRRLRSFLVLPSAAYLNSFVLSNVLCSCCLTCNLWCFFLCLPIRHARFAFQSVQQLLEHICMSHASMQVQQFTSSTQALKQTGHWQALLHATVCAGLMILCRTACQPGLPCIDESNPLRPIQRTRSLSRLGLEALCHLHSVKFLLPVSLAKGVC